MKLMAFLMTLTLSYATVNHANFDNAPMCEDDFTANQTNGHYQPMSNGLTQDPLTGLTWFRCSAGQNWKDGQCQGSPLLLPYKGARQWAKSLKLAGFDDWRVPKIDEMSSLIETHCRSPAINTRIFLGIEPEVYWSSEPNFWIKPMAWSLFFYRGDYFNKQAKVDSFRFMLVRD